MLSYTELEKKVKEHLKQSRYTHSLGVESISIDLAKKFSLNIDYAKYMSIFHDYSRYDSTLLDIPFIEQSGFTLIEEERKDPILLHGPLAASLFDNIAEGEVSKELKVAVRHHTLGNKEMGKYGAVLYIADFIEPGREYLSNYKRDEILSLDSLEEMVLEVINESSLLFKDDNLLSPTEELCTFLLDGGKFS